MGTGSLTLVNGRSEATIDLSDRGFQFGDGIFTTLPVNAGIPLFAKEHLDRLIRDAAILKLPLPDREILSREIAQLVGECPDGILKIHWTRGVGGRGYQPSEPVTPSRVLVLRPTPPLDLSVPNALTLRYAEMRLGINPSLAGAKHMNRLEQVLARLEWNDPAIDEALLLDSEGCVVEGVSTNLFLLHGTTLITPLLDRAGVRGVMRDLLIGMAARFGWSVREDRVRPENLKIADALFVTNSVRGICAVGALDGTVFATDPFAKKVHEGYLDEISRTRGQWL